MKKISVFLIILVLITGCSTTKSVKKVNTYENMRNYVTEDYKQPKKKIAVVDFSNNTRFGERRLGEAATDVLLTELKKSKRFVVLERENVDEMMKQIKLSKKGLTKGNLKNLNMLDANYLVMGSVSKYSTRVEGEKSIFSKSKKQIAEVAVDLRLVDTKTGEIIIADTGEGKAVREHSQVMGWGSSGSYDESLENDAFRSSVIKLVENIVNTLDKKEWYCNVVKIKNNKLYLDAGKKANIDIRDSFSLYKIGEPIKDLDGKLIGYEKNKIGKIHVKEYLGQNGSVAKYKGNNELKLPLICKLK